MEIWKNINGFPNYEASSLGNIRSKLTGKIMKVCKNRPDQRGYYQISLTMDINSRLTRKVHTLVCIAFHGNPPTNLHTVNHKDGNKLNNNKDNLEWVTAKENTNHLFKNGLQPKRVKLKYEDLEKIKNLYNIKKISFKEIAQLYNVKSKAIRRMILGETWNF